MRRFMSLAAMVCLGACDGLGGGLPYPTADEAKRAVTEIGYRASKHTVHVAVDAATPTNCTEGALGDQPTLTCNVCYYTLAVYLDAPTALERALYASETNVSGLDASRRTLQVTFKRSASFDQPDVLPLDPSNGVWALSLPSGLLNLGEVQQQVVPTQADYDRWGVHASMDDVGLSFEGPIGNQMLSVEQVAEKMRNDLVSMLGECS